MYNVVTDDVHQKAFMLTKKSRRKGQVGVMDRGLAAVLGAAALLGLIGVYFHNTSDVAADNQVNQINTIAAQINRMYASQPTIYAKLTDASVANSGALAPTWIDGAGTGLNSVYNSPITLLPTTNTVTTRANGAYTMTIKAVPQAACTILGTTTYAPTTIKATAGGTDLGITPSNPVADPTTVANACAAGAKANGGVDMVFTFS